MADDIGANGQREPIKVLPDGRNRELGCLIAGVAPEYVVVEIEERAVPAFVRSANVHRRHLTADQKRAAIADALRANPEKSNNAIAAELKVSDKTVSARRSDMEATSEFPKLGATTGRDGRTRTAKPSRARKPKPVAADAIAVASETAVPSRGWRLLLLGSRPHPTRFRSRVPKTAGRSIWP